MERRRKTLKHNIQSLAEQRLTAELMCQTAVWNWLVITTCNLSFKKCSRETAISEFGTSYFSYTPLISVGAMNDFDFQSLSKAVLQCGCLLPTSNLYSLFFQTGNRFYPIELIEVKRSSILSIVHHLFFYPDTHCQQILFWEA